MAARNLLEDKLYDNVLTAYKKWTDQWDEVIMIHVAITTGNWYSRKILSVRVSLEISHEPLLWPIVHSVQISLAMNISYDGKYATPVSFSARF